MVGAASIFSWIMAAEQVPATIARVVFGESPSYWIFYIVSICVFVVLGALLEGLPAVIICLPIFLPIATKLGINSLHYSTIVVAAIGVGLFLPPIGIGQYIASSFANLRVDQTARAMMPYLGALFLGILILIAFPWLVLVLPQAVLNR